MTSVLDMFTTGVGPSSSHTVGPMRAGRAFAKRLAETDLLERTARIRVTHAKAEIGCAKCHGASDRHIDDESWTWGGKGTPPDKMVPRQEVNSFCVTCHDMSKSEAGQHDCPYPAMNPKKTCTDCHGKHRLANRKCKWK